MNKDELESVSSFLGAYWCDNGGDDVSNVNEYVMDSSSEAIKRTINSIRQFLDSTDSMEFKSEVIRKAAWVYFPKEDVEAPIVWLREILALLEEASIHKGTS